jgi:hypothetical protein
VLVDIELIHSPSPVQPQVIHQWSCRLGQGTGTGYANGVEHARLIARVQEELEDRRSREKPQVGRVEQPSACVLKIAAEQCGQERVVLKVRDRGQHDALGSQEATVAPQQGLGVDEVLQNVAEEDAIEAVWLQRRIVRDDIQTENPIEAFGSPCCYAGLAFDARNGAVGPPVLEGSTQMALRTADFEDPASTWANSPQ